MQHAVLIIDDSAVARQMIRDILEDAFADAAFFEAGDAGEGFALLECEAIDVVLCDLKMPGGDGFKFLGMVNSRDELRDIPVIILTGHEDLDEKIRGLKEGASDFLTKPFHSRELAARVMVQLKLKMLQDSLKESNRRLEELSRTDPLTGLANRREFMAQLQREVAHSQRTRLPLSLVMFDLDHFKQVNDRYGHQGGDEVLVAVGRLLKRSLRTYDCAARYGGEEFALILPETDGEKALEAAERLRLSTEKLRFEGALASLRLTSSLGVATCPAESVDSPDALIALADAALYRAKRNGRNRVETDR